jgi:hypothetical protein
VHGVCVDALRDDGSPSYQAMKPFKAVRLVFFHDPRWYIYAQQLLDQGIEVYAVLARESFPSLELIEIAGFCWNISKNITPTAWVIGNEMDAWALSKPSRSSWSMEPDEYYDFWRACLTGLDRTVSKVLVGGFVSGLPEVATQYLSAITESDGYDVHPYAKDASEAEKLLELYRAYLGTIRPFYVLEWNRKPGEIQDYVRMLERLEVKAASFFSWHPVDISSLRDQYGNPTESYQELVEAIGQLKPPEEPVAANWDGVGEGVRNYMESKGDTPLTIEEYQYSKTKTQTLGYQWSVTWGTKGFYIASNKSGSWQIAGPFPVPMGNL